MQRQPKRIEGRSGWTLAIPLPSELTRVNAGPISFNSLVIKAGYTHSGAMKNEHKIELNDQQKINALLKRDPIETTFNQVGTNVELYLVEHS